MPFSFVPGHPLSGQKTIDYASAAQKKQAAIKAHPANTRQVATHSVIDVTGHPTNGNISQSSYMEDD